MKVMDLQKHLERRPQGALQAADDLTRAIANARQKFDIRSRDNRAQIRDLEGKLRAVKTDILWLEDALKRASTRE
jgi:LPS O-antigen subunit length determinant protein (WzzB/FepE family)